MSRRDCGPFDGLNCTNSVVNVIPETGSIKPVRLSESHQRGAKSGGFTDKLVNAFNDVLSTVKKKIGLLDCLNGGRRTTEGVCDCPPYFEGETCGDLICVNNGTKIELPNQPPFCKCPHPYISGMHCEIVRCDNNGQPLKNGHCRCLDYWYTGQFCENYTASWGAVIGVPLVCITVIVICCIICRLDFCPRRKIRQTRRRRSGNLAEVASGRTGRWVRSVDEQLDQRQVARQRGHDAGFRLQENLLNEEMASQTRCTTRVEPNAISSYTIRLDTIPVFNPRMIGGVSEQGIRLREPPPPYDQAINLSFPQHMTSQNGDGDLQSPPSYTPNPNVRLPLAAYKR